MALPKQRVKTWRWVYCFEPQWALGVVVSNQEIHFAFGPLVFGWEKQ